MANGRKLNQTNKYRSCFTGNQMKFRILSCLFLIINLSCYAKAIEVSDKGDTLKHNKTNAIKKPLTRGELQRLEKLHKPWFDNCTFTNQYTVAQRLKKYPFSKAVKILAVSYYAFDGPVTDILDSLGNPLFKDTIVNKGLQICKQRLNYSNLIEVKRLTESSISRLSNILFNTDYKVKMGINTFGEGACFEPRNAIIFFDKKGKVFDYLEVCFACENYSSKSDKINVGTICTEKYDLLRKYFISVDVKYGTKKHMHGN